MRRYLFILLLAILSLKLPVEVFADQYWEYWSKYSFELAWNKNSGLSLQPEFRFKDNFREYYYSKTYIGLFYKLNSFVVIKGYYAYKTKKGNDGWGHTDLLYLDPELRFNLGAFDLSNRFRFEYDFDEEELVYRDRLKFKRSLYKSITPFIQEEAFYSFSSGTLVENRFSVGLAVKVLNNIGLSAEYMLNSKKVDSNWEEANILVSGLGFTF